MIARVTSNSSIEKPFSHEFFSMSFRPIRPDGVQGENLGSRAVSVKSPDKPFPEFWDPKKHPPLIK